MTCKYCGRLVTGATLELADGSRREVLPCPGHVYDLPEDHAWVRRMVKRGYLDPVPEQKTRKTKTAPEQAAVAVSG